MERPVPILVGTQYFGRLARLCGQLVETPGLELGTVLSAQLGCVEKPARPNFDARFSVVMGSEMTSLPIDGMNEVPKDAPRSSTNWCGRGHHSSPFEARSRTSVANQSTQSSCSPVSTAHES